MNILIPTADGSITLYNQEIGEHYHSAHGALQEAKHVFINAGLLHRLQTLNSKKIKILEVGFGTGLNFLLTLDFALQQKIEIDYTGLEPFPIEKNIIEKTKNDRFVASQTWSAFLNAYPAAIGMKTVLNASCLLKIVPLKLADYKSEQTFDLIYYDAFSVKHQPQMWTNEIIAHTCNFLKTNGIFVTYAITANLQKAIKACGLRVEKLKGALGKREMLRAIKI